MINKKNLKKQLSNPEYSELLYTFLNEADKLPEVRHKNQDNQNTCESLVFDFLMNHIQYGVLREMSAICRKRDGFGFFAIIRSDDHDPPHFHVSDNDNKSQKVLLTEKIPQKMNDIVMYKNNNITQALKRKIVKWANSIDKIAKVQNWILAQALWDRRR